MKDIKNKIGKKLSEILSEETFKKCSGINTDFTVSDVSDNSKNVSENSLFVAIKGTNAINTKKYIEEAISKGAKCVVFENDNTDENFRESFNKNGVLFIPVKNSRYELAYIASHFFESKLDNVAAVTGTNGKTSTVDIIRQIWAHNNRNALSIGTLGIISENKISENKTKVIHKKLSETLTSPKPIELHKILNSFSVRLDRTISVAIEASSHGIDQHRLDCIPFSICAFTNFTQDHLDYHKTMDKYWIAKERLFSELSNSKTKFVANADDEKFERIQEISKIKKNQCIGYGFSANDVKIIDVKLENTNQIVKISFLDREFSFKLPLSGKFQVYNALCAMISCYLSGINLENVLEAVEKVKPIKGRLELVSDFNSTNIYIDYAHTPDALKSSILSVREYNPKRIITVFGCGGERDFEKRHLMGEIAENFSDVVIVTDDNPRKESPEEIRKMILKGCKKAVEIAPREKAIEYAINIAKSGDCVLIAGKGHENYQQIGNEFFHFDDKEVILNKVRSK